jgi:hypothetical protein
VRNGDWHKHEEQRPIPALRTTLNYPSPVPVDRPQAEPHRPEGFLATIKKLPWWSLIYLGIAIGGAMNSRACSP